MISEDGIDRLARLMRPGNRNRQNAGRCPACGTIALGGDEVAKALFELLSPPGWIASVAARDTQPLTPGDTGTSARAQGSTTDE